MPGLSATYLPLLAATAALHWPTAPEPWVMAAQIEKETCVTLKHWKCWNPRAELKTSRENGVGLGQVTRAFKPDGSIRFDKQAELRAEFPRQLGDWQWADRYNPDKQLLALVLMDRKGFGRFRKMAATEADAWAFTLSGYNGGDGHVLRDMSLCRKQPGCDPTRWHGNVALYSVKSRVKWKGYGASAYEVNRWYVKRIWERRDFYRGLWPRQVAPFGTPGSRGWEGL